MHRPLLLALITTLLLLAVEPLSFLSKHKNVDPHLIVQTAFGPIQGQYNPPNIKPFNRWRRPSRSWSRSFRGVPYAPQPQRFTRAQEWTLNWSTQGILNAKRGHRACWQILDPFRSSENCLFMNIFVPPRHRLDLRRGDTGNRVKLLPVLLWVYGGSFFFGDIDSLNMYDGGFVVQHKDVIVVTVNYRVGPFGFLTYPTSQEMSGNYGYHDLLLALSWVKRHIHAFGGDSERITLYGMSSGATLVAHALLDVHAPLFQGAMVMSGPFGLLPKSRRAMDAIGEALAAKLGCHRRKHHSIMRDVVQCLRKVSPMRLALKGTLELSGFGFQSHDGHPIGDANYWSLVIDDKHIRGSIMDIVSSLREEEKLRLSKISVVAGNSADEMAFFTNTVTLNAPFAKTLFHLADLNTPVSMQQPEVKHGRRLAGLKRVGAYWWFKMSLNKRKRDQMHLRRRKRNIERYINLIITVFGRGNQTNTHAQVILRRYPPSPSIKQNLVHIKHILNGYMFHCGTRRFLDHISMHTPASYRYMFQHVPSWGRPLFGQSRRGVLAGFEGTPHAMDFPFVFHKFPVLRHKQDDVLSRWIIDRLVAFATDPMHIDEEQLPRALAVMTMEQGLSRNCTDGCEKVNVPWTPYTVEEDRPVMVFDTPRVYMDSGYDDTVCDFWNKLDHDY